MGIKLRQVESTNDKGLVGITENGEEVLLGVPQPNILIVSVNRDCFGDEKKWISYLAQREQEASIDFIKSLQESVYVRFYNRQFIDMKNIFVIPYNSFYRRKK